MGESAQGSFGSAVEFVEEDLPRADLAQLETVMQELEGGVWSGTIRAAERERKKASVVELRAALDRLRQAAAAREQARVVRKERPASSRREFLPAEPEFVEIVGDQDGQHGWKRPPRILQELAGSSSAERSAVPLFSGALQGFAGTFARQRRALGSVPVPEGGVLQ